MGDPGAAGTGTLGAVLVRQRAGAVVVPVEPAAPAAPAPPRPAWARVSARVTWAGAGAATAPPAGAAGALPRAAAAAARAPQAWTRLSARLALAAALFLLGCAAAGLAFFAMILPPADSRLLACTPPTDAEVVGLRTASEYLLLAASAQVLAVAATMGLLVPAWLVAVFVVLLGWLTACRATDVLWMLVACHGSAHAVLWAALAVGAVVSLR